VHVSAGLRDVTDYVMDRWLEDRHARISLAEIRRHLEESASAPRDKHLDAEMESLIAVFKRCDGIDVDATEVRVMKSHHSLLRKLFQTMDAVVDEIATSDARPPSGGRRAVPAEPATSRTSVLDQLDEELASQRSKLGRGRS